MAAMEMIDPAAPFQVGHKVRLFGGPELTVMREVDEDGEVLCCWWTPLGQLGFVYAPEQLLIHVQAVEVTSDYPGAWDGPSPIKSLAKGIKGWFKRRGIKNP